MRDFLTPSCEVCFTTVNASSEPWHSSHSRDTISVVLPTIHSVSPIPKPEVHEKEVKRTKVKNFTPMNLSQDRGYYRLEDVESLDTREDLATQEIIAFNTVTHDPGWRSKSPTIPSRLKHYKEQKSRLLYHKANRNLHNKSVDFSDSEWAKGLPSSLLPIRKKMSQDDNNRKYITPIPAHSNRESHVSRYERKEQDTNLIKLKSIVSPSKTPSLKSKKEQLMKKVKKVWTPAPKKLFQYKDKSSKSISPEQNAISHQIIFSPEVKILSSLGRGVLIKL